MATAAPLKVVLPKAHSGPPGVNLAEAERHRPPDLPQAVARLLVGLLREAHPTATHRGQALQEDPGLQARPQDRVPVAAEEAEGAAEAAGEVATLEPECHEQHETTFLGLLPHGLCHLGVGPK